ncbi:MAG: epoxyqueuosine reductase QueH [Candidatus Woesearchaeota archaeon]
MKILLHVCCGPCSAHAIEQLKRQYELTAFFYNPNIWPRGEYAKRLTAAIIVCKQMGVEFLDRDYDTANWETAVAGFESEPEGGKRCEKCFEYRLKKTAEYANKNGFQIFATTLTTSPHKDSKKINKIGKHFAEEYGIEFVQADFKKQDGFLKSNKMSKEMGIYRQSYCGCRFSSNIASPKL